ncbi:uncharacterized protein LOC123290406 [Chrysoperla carnea]|uniref:uncharacterized protein LOC123290406 n=1 Tax=Chrysoperla carnea TaxID=189513 RepID=UPI001D06DE26|nr:uncharacterized protein LOC123290406 [Chrysoperla carnea]
MTPELFIHFIVKIHKCYYIIMAFYLFIYVELCSSVNSEDPCTNKIDGFHTTIESNCQNYYYCINEKLIQNQTCQNDYAFSSLKQICVPAFETSCIDIKCPLFAINNYYTIPDTKCKMYYQCFKNGERKDYICPENMSFSYELQTCVKKGLCYDPVCTGRVNGNYPDTTQGCIRNFNCTGGKIVSIEHCKFDEIFSETQRRCVKRSNDICQLPQETAVAFPIQQRGNICARLDDGVYTVPNSDCKEYFICKSHVNLGTLTCGNDFIFNGKECVFQEYYQCKDQGCSNLEDGIYTDLHSGCQDYFYCLENKVIWRQSCPENSLHDGIKCVDEKSYKCPLLLEHDMKVCLNLKDGYHRNHIKCNEYFYCVNNELIMKGTCPGDQIWNGFTCVDRGWYFCEGPKEWIGCLIKEGYFTDTSPSSQCTNYYYCSRGQVTYYACPPTESFDGEKCIHKSLYNCPTDEMYLNVCEKEINGFHVQDNTKCQKYVQCQNGKVYREFVCPHNQVFDGINGCVYNNCTKTLPKETCNKEGFFLDLDSNCTSYYFCIDGRRTDLKCPTDTLFNGQVCVSKNTYKCPESCHRFRRCGDLKW